MVIRPMPQLSVKTHTREMMQNKKNKVTYD